jgi:hypothetical protein
MEKELHEVSIFKKTQKTESKLSCHSVYPKYLQGLHTYHARDWAGHSTSLSSQQVSSTQANNLTTLTTVQIGEEDTNIILYFDNMQAYGTSTMNQVYPEQAVLSQYTDWQVRKGTPTILIPKYESKTNTRHMNPKHTILNCSFTSFHAGATV